MDHKILLGSIGSLKMAFNKYTVQMTISFTGTKNFKKAKQGFAFHKVIEQSISDLKPDGSGPINERIKNPNFVVSNVGGSNFECILNVPISDLNEEIRKLILSFISKLRKNFQKWGKYKILIKNAIILQNVENVKI